MTVPTPNEDSGHSRAGALEALREAAQEADMVEDYPRVSGAFDAEDYEQIIGIAWRNQFDDDRTRFKREIRVLQEQISQRILANRDASQ